MSPSPPIALIFGSGANIGKTVAHRFLTAGYRVATVSRSASDPPITTPDGILSIRADFSQPSSIPAVFAAVRAAFGSDASPRVVVYNAATLTLPPDEKNMFSIGAESIQKDVAVAVTSPFVAAGEAIKAWTADGREDAGPRAFIYTGNLLPVKPAPVPRMTTLGIGKAGALYWIQQADLIYKEKGIRFIFADGRKPDGSSLGSNPDPETHAEFYLKIAEGKSDDVPSYATFANGSYAKF